MKKSNLFKILSASITSLFLLSGVSFAEGEWATSGNNIYNTNSGNVGIGTTGPSGKLQVVAAATDRVVLSNDTSGDVNTNSPKLSFYGWNTSSSYIVGPSIQKVNKASYGRGDLVFWQHGGADYTSETEAMVITYNGNIGIGTIDPSHKLHVNTGGAHVKTYSYGLETTVDTTGGWARSMRFRNEYDNAVSAFGALHGEAYIATGFDPTTDPTGYQSTRLLIKSNGNVGIGTTNPRSYAALDVNTTGNKSIYTMDSTNGGLLIGYQGSTIQARTTASGNNQNLILQKWGGNVGIGTTSPQSKLAVNGTITTKEVNVTESGWSDFVFDDDYSLPTLDHVESYIKENKHLPDIPSAKEVKEQGLSVSEMIAKQMQKIEELTLYITELNDRIAALEKERDEMHNGILRD